MNIHGTLLYVLLFAVTLSSIQDVQAQEKNPSLTIRTVEIPWFEFNRISSEAPVVEFDQIHAISWQVTISKDLLYENPRGNAVLRLYDDNVEGKFVDVGMGAPPDGKFWVAVNLPGAEEYVVVHSKLERGWAPNAKTIVAYTDRAGMTINNGERIVVSNLDIGEFIVSGYSVFGKEGTTDPPAVFSGVYSIDILSGDPAENVFHLFPFYVTAVVGVIVGVLFLTKRRS